MYYIIVNNLMTALKWHIFHGSRALKNLICEMRRKDNCVMDKCKAWMLSGPSSDRTFPPHTTVPPCCLACSIAARYWSTACLVWRGPYRVLAVGRQLQSEFLGFHTCGAFPAISCIDHHKHSLSLVTIVVAQQCFREMQPWRVQSHYWRSYRLAYGN